MPTKDRNDTNATVLRLKQVSIERALAVASEACRRGSLRILPRPTNVPLVQELRVKAS